MRNNHGGHDNIKESSEHMQRTYASKFSKNIINGIFMKKLQGFPMPIKDTKKLPRFYSVKQRSLKHFSETETFINFLSLKVSRLSLMKLHPAVVYSV